MKKLALILIFFFSVLQTFAQQAVERFNGLYYESLGRTSALYTSKGVISKADYFEKHNYAAAYFTLLKRYKNNGITTGFLFYFYSNDSLHICLLNAERVLIFSNAVTKDSLLRTETALRHSLKVDEMIASRMPIKRGTHPLPATSQSHLTIKQAVAAASKLLLPKKLAAKIGRLEHLFILPELNIGRFPFYILQPFGNDSFLVDKMSIAFIPRLVNPLYGNDNAGTAEKTATQGFSNPLIVGNPKFSSSAAYQFPTLQGAEEEAKLVADLFHSPFLTGTEATISVIKRKSVDADLLYFATHAVFDMDKMLEGSFIAFAADEKDSTGSWIASDIQQCNLVAKLAVLSACQTGVGKIFDGGFVSIGQSFYMAGVPHTVTSLWSVDDKSTKELMLAFMNEITKPAYFYPAAHLRTAILNYKKENGNIAQWAPFSVYGF